MSAFFFPTNASHDPNIPAVVEARSEGSLSPAFTPRSTQPQQADGGDGVAANSPAATGPETTAIEEFSDIDNIMSDMEQVMYQDGFQTIVKKMDELPTEVVVLVMQLSEGAALLRLRATCKYFDLVFMANAVDQLRASLQPPPSNWAMTHATIDQRAEDKRRRRSLNTLDEDVLTGNRSSVINIQPASPEEDAAAAATVEVGGDNAANPLARPPGLLMDGVGPVAADGPAASPFQLPVAGGSPNQNGTQRKLGNSKLQSERDRAKKKARSNRFAREWIRELGNFRSVKHNIRQALFDYTTLEKHSHAAPLILPNGILCFSRWQLIAIYVRTCDRDRSGFEIPNTAKWIKAGYLGSHTDTVTSMRYDPRRKTMLSSSFDGTIKRWNIREDKHHRRGSEKNEGLFTCVTSYQISVNGVPANNFQIFSFDVMDLKDIMEQPGEVRDHTCPCNNTSLICCGAESGHVALLQIDDRRSATLGIFNTGESRIRSIRFLNKELFASDSEADTPLQQNENGTVHMVVATVVSVHILAHSINRRVVNTEVPAQNGRPAYVRRSYQYNGTSLSITRLQTLNFSDVPVSFDVPRLCLNWPIVPRHPKEKKFFAAPREKYDTVHEHGDGNPYFTHPAAFFFYEDGCCSIASQNRAYRPPNQDLPSHQQVESEPQYRWDVLAVETAAATCGKVSPTNAFFAIGTSYGGVKLVVYTHGKRQGNQGTRSPASQASSWAGNPQGGASVFNPEAPSDGPLAPVSASTNTSAAAVAGGSTGVHVDGGDSIEGDAEEMVVVQEQQPHTPETPHQVAGDPNDNDNDQAASGSTGGVIPSAQRSASLGADEQPPDAISAATTAATDPEGAANNSHVQQEAESSSTTTSDILSPPPTDHMQESNDESNSFNWENDADTSGLFLGPNAHKDPMCKQLVNTKFLSATPTFVTVPLLPSHRCPVMNIHLDGWKATTVDALVFVHVYNLATKSLLFCITPTMAPSQFGYQYFRNPVSQIIAMDCEAKMLTQRHVQWQNGTLLISPLPVSSHTLLADFTREFEAPAPPSEEDFQQQSAALSQAEQPHASPVAANAHVHQGEKLPDPSPLTPLQKPQHPPQKIVILRSSDSEAYFPPQRQARRKRGLPAEMNPNNSNMPLLALTDPSERVIVPMQSVPLSFHLLYVLLPPFSFFMLTLLLVLIALRLDGYITAPWTALLTVHYLMLPHYFSINAYWYKPLLAHYSGSSFFLRVTADWLYLVVAPLLFALKQDGFAFENLSWLFVSWPCSLAIIFALVAARMEDAFEKRHRVTLNPEVARKKYLRVSVAQLCHTLLVCAFITHFSVYFDGDSVDGNPLASFSYSSQNIFVVFIPAWILLAAYSTRIPSLVSFTPDQNNLCLSWAHYLVTLFVLFLVYSLFAIVPVVLLCVKFDNWYQYKHHPETMSITPISTLNHTDVWPQLLAANMTEQLTNFLNIVNPFNASASSSSSGQQNYFLVNGNLTTFPNLSSVVPGAVPVDVSVMKTEPSHHSVFNHMPIIGVVSPLICALLLTDVMVTKNLSNHWKQLQRVRAQQ